MARLDGNVSMVEKVYIEIKDRILTGEFLPGVHLIEAGLSLEYKVSRVTIRDALRRLTYDELVDLRPNSGIWVRRLTYHEIVDLYMVREPMEMLAAKLAAEQPSERLQGLIEICSQGAEAVARLDRLTHRSLNRRFHQAIALSSGNRTLIKLLERLNTQMIANQFMSVMRDEDIRMSQKAHEILLAAILAGDSGKAGEIMGQHIQKGREFALASVRAVSNKNEDF